LVVFRLAMSHALASALEWTPDVATIAACPMAVLPIADRSSMDVRTESAGDVAGTELLFMKYQAAAAISARMMIAHNHPSPPRFGSTLISAITASTRASLRQSESLRDREER
jgi:hypothetical protein